MAVRAPRSHAASPCRQAPGRRRDLGQARALDELPLGGLEDLAEQRPRDPQQVGDLRVREPIVDLVPATLADDEQVAPSTARCCERCDASRPVASSSSETDASGAAESTSSTRMRIGCARPLKSSALTS